MVDVLRSLRPRRCLEWGAGASTLYFPGYLAADASWLAIEHDGAWAASTQHVSQHPNVVIAHVAPDRTPWNGDGTAKDFAAYLAYPAQRGPFDFILVD